MKEMLKNKAVITFIVLMVGLSFIGGTTTKLEQSSANIEEEYLAYNLH